MGGFLLISTQLQAEGTLWVSPLASPTVVAVTPSPTSIIIAQPSKIVIPTLGLETQVEIVGQDSQGRMDVPKADANVAWYQLGAKPGEIGSAVVAGHYDSKTGGPAVFYELSSLQPGDEINVVGAQNEQLTFVVEKIETYKDATFPVKTVFSQNDARRLNLITCAGTFDKTAKNYSDRTVVFTKLKNS